MRPIIFKIFKGLCSFMLAALLFSSCQEISEVDISCSKIKLLTPPDSLQSASGIFHFKWEELEDAITYNFELATPDFENPLYYHTDTTTALKEIVLALSPGQYTWRVQGENASSTTPWYARTLFVDTSVGLEGVPMVLTSPSDNSILDNTSVSFTWQEIELAEYYTFQLLYNNNGVVGEVYSLAQPQEASLAMNVPEGHWYWRVQGEIFGSSPSNYAQRALTVDQTAPSVSELTFPLGDVFEAESNNFTWNAAIDQLTVVTETIEIFSDEDATILVESLSGVSSPVSIDLSDYVVGTYYWGIYSEDQAGNYSESILGTFQVQ